MLIFWSKRWQPKDIPKLTDLYFLRQYWLYMHFFLWSWYQNQNIRSFKIFDQIIRNIIQEKRKRKHQSYVYQIHVLRGQPISEWGKSEEIYILYHHRIFTSVVLIISLIVRSCVDSLILSDIEKNVIVIQNQFFIPLLVSDKFILQKPSSFLLFYFQSYTMCPSFLSCNVWRVWCYKTIQWLLEKN